MQQMKTIYIQKIKILASLILALMVFTSCEDFLEEEPRTQVDINAFYQNESDALAGLTGALSLIHI